MFVGYNNDPLQHHHAAPLLNWLVVYRNSYCTSTSQGGAFYYHNKWSISMYYTKPLQSPAPNLSIWYITCNWEQHAGRSPQTDGATHKESGHRNGLFILLPLSRNVRISNASTPGYGDRPRLNTSQHVTPNDHWKGQGSRTQIKQEVHTGRLSLKINVLSTINILMNKLWHITA